MPGVSDEDLPIRRAAVEIAGIRTALFVPLRKDATVLGYISAQRQQVKPFSAKAPTPERCLEAYHLHRTRLELIAERKVRRPGSGWGLAARLCLRNALSRAPTST
jgi:hypothetical protein